MEFTDWLFIVAVLMSPLPLLTLLIREVVVQPGSRGLAVLRETSPARPIEADPSTPHEARPASSHRACPAAPQEFRQTA